MLVKAKGINAERELIHLFWSSEWSAVRVAGSGSSRYPSPDILASNTIRKLAIESKVTKDSYKHFPSKEINELKEFSEKFGAEPWIAIKFKGNDWLFLRLKDIQPTKENYAISLDLAKKQGMDFKSLISGF